MARKLNHEDIKFLFNILAHGKTEFTQSDFDKEFANIQFNGRQIIPTQSQALKTKNSIQVKNVEASAWETDVIDKLRRMIKKSGKSLDHVFSQID